MALAASFVIKHFATARLPSSKPVNASAYFYGAAAWNIMAAIFILERAPWTYFLYAAFPSLFWSEVFRDPQPLLSVPRAAVSSPSLLLGIVAVVGTLELAVLGYFHRQAWTAGFILLGCVAPLLSTPPSFRQVKANRQLAVAWALSCLVMSIFTLLPVEKGESLLTMCGFFLLFLLLRRETMMMAQICWSPAFHCDGNGGGGTG